MRRIKSLIMFCAEDKREKPRNAVLGDSKADALYWGLVRESTTGKPMGSYRQARLRDFGRKRKSNRRRSGI